MRKETRVDPAFLASQKTKRTTLNDAPGQAGGLPALNDRVEIIEQILAIHNYTET